jgi:hypothetical protein
MLSADDLVVRRIDQGIRGGDEPYSVWSLGTVVGAHGEPYNVLLWTDVFRRNGQRTAILGQTFRGGSDGRYPRDPAMRDREWVIPTNPGLTEIVAVSGQRGVVTLVGEHGERLTFDLTTEQWTIESIASPDATPATVTPGP